MHRVYKNIIERCCNDLKKTQEAQNIWENELPGNSIGKTQKSQEDVYYDSSEEFHSCHDAPLNSSSSPSMDLQDSTKQRIIQRRR
jgi:hypothetical protein